MSNYKNTLHHIRGFAFDVDGVLTDGGVISLPDGDLFRVHYARDGYAIRVAIENGYKVAIITGGISPSVTLRYQKLGVTDIYTAARNKLPCLQDFCKKNNLDLSQVAYAGDDIPDLAPMRACGLPFCPSDACHEVLEAAAYVSPYVGGRGVARDLIEQVMTLHNKWNV